MATQADITDSLANYFDIMILGLSGMGKSTTADKLLMANPTDRNYLDGQQSGCGLDEDEGRVKADDISMWILSEKQQYGEERMRTRVKNLVFYRSLSDALKEVNQARDSSMNSFSSTKECELLSNETTKIRVLDVPGFFHSQAGLTDASALDSRNLELMRKILHIQAAMRLKFRRLLYFLPIHGALMRENPILSTELKSIYHFFGRSIFESMVLVATVPTHISMNEGMPDEEKCPQYVLEKSQTAFYEAMKDMFPQACDERPLVVPPIIFIVMTDSCERTLEKVRDVQVHNKDGLQLKCDRNTCVDCGMKTTVVDGKGVACYFYNEDEAMPYSDSKCHPRLVPKLSSKIRHGFLSMFRRRAVLQGEICVGCKKGPNSPGCMKVGTVLNRRLRRNITVDHNNELTAEDDTENNTPISGEPTGRESPMVGNPSLVAVYNPTYHNIHHQEPARQPMNTHNYFEDRKG